MSTHDFEDPTEKAEEGRRSRAKELSRSSGAIIQSLSRFKTDYDALYASSSVDQQANLDTKFTEFKLAAKNALGL